MRICKHSFSFGDFMSFYHLDEKSTVFAKRGQGVMQGRVGDRTETERSGGE